MTAKTYKIINLIFSVFSLICILLSNLLLIQRFFFIKPSSFEIEMGMYHGYTASLNANLYFFYLFLCVGIFFATLALITKFLENKNVIRFK